MIDTTLSQSTEDKKTKYKYVIKQLLRLKAHSFYYIRYYTVFSHNLQNKNDGNVIHIGTMVKKEGLNLLTKLEPGAYSGICPGGRASTFHTALFTISNDMIVVIL